MPRQTRREEEVSDVWAASNYREGRAIDFELVAKLVTQELAYMLEIERFEAKVGDSDEMTPVVLRLQS